MSTSQDERAIADGRHDRLGELSPPERDFLARRMPVEPVNCPPLDAFRVDVPPPAPPAPTTPSKFAKSKVDKLRFEMGVGSVWLRAAGLDSLADDVLRLAKEIGGALK